MKTLDNLRDVFKAHESTANPSKFTAQDAAAQISVYPAAWTIGLTPQKYLCSNCGYIGSVFMELEKEEEKKEWRNNPLNRAILGSAVS